MGRFSVVGLSSICLLSLATAVSVRADDWHCTEIERPTTINSDKRCVRVEEKVRGDVVNNATVGRADRDRPGFFVGGDGLITGQLINNGTITGGGGPWGALTLGRDGDVEGGIVNNGTIVSTRGNAINLGYRENAWWSPRAAALTGDIVNNGLIDGKTNGIAALYGTMTGALINEADGTITGGDVAVLIANSFTRWTGGIENRGLIAGDEAGIQIGSLTGYGVVFEGGIENLAGAEITSISGPSVAIGGERFSGGFFNGGLITQTGAGGVYEGVGIVFAARSVDGDLTNDTTGVIEGTMGAAVWVTSRTLTFAGDLVNRGLIDGATDGVLLQADSFMGSVINAAGAKILGGSGTGLRIGGTTFSGGVDNAGLIDGATDGVLIETTSFAGGVRNASGGKILGGSGAGLKLAGADFAGGIENAGLIEGGDGVWIGSGLFGGGFFNAATGLVAGLDGDGLFASAAWSGDFENLGDIAGSVRGVAYVGPGFAGDVSNTGAIEGGVTGFFFNTALFDGAFSNAGDVTGGTDGVHLILGQATGGFANSGDVRGDSGTGVFIDVGTWGSAEAPADIVNAAGGTIFGGQTGFWLKALNVFGDFVNNGTIKGGAANTGLHIEAATYVGDIVNNALIEAPSNAMLIEIEELIGQVRNTGTIKATASNGVAVNLAIGNGTTFTNDEGGLILGDVLLGGPAAYAFVAGDGGLEGSLIGSGGDDDLIVEGTHYFVDGALENLGSFEVTGGGVAVMGGRSVGDANGPGYGASDVDALIVRSGGQLYLDNNTILNVGSYTQEAGGELTYYLVAPAGTPAAGTDYGRINASGPVSLNGTLSVILDAASFGGTTQNTFNYTDIIKGSSFTGEFEDFEIRGSTYFFDLQLTYGSSSINLGVTRTPFDVILCEQFQTQNAEELGAAIEAAFLAGGFTPEQIQFFNFLGQINDICGAYFDLGGAVLGDVHGITVETAGPWKSAVNDRLNSTGATSCVVAGPGACLTRFAQAEVGGTQVMNDAEDPFAWLRTGVRPEGQFSVWGRLIGVQGDNQGRGAALGSDFTVTGGIGGADYVFSQRFIAGVAAQWTNTDVDFKQRVDTADVQSFEIGGYFSYGDADFCLNGNASIIFHDFDTYRFPFGGTAHGAYEGTTVSAYVEAGQVFEFDALRVEPLVALTFAGLDTDAYVEDGTAVNSLLSVEGASHRSFKSIAGVRVAYPLDWLESGRKIVPEARILWAHEYLDDQAQFRAALQVLPNNPFNVRGQRFSRDSLLGGVGLNVPLSSRAVLYADYDVSLSRDRSIQSLSVGARYSW